LHDSVHSQSWTPRREEDRSAAGVFPRSDQSRSGKFQPWAITVLPATFAASELRAPELVGPPQAFCATAEGLAQHKSDTRVPLALLISDQPPEQ